MFDNYDLFSLMGIEPEEQVELKGNKKKDNTISVIGLDKAKNSSKKADKSKTSSNQAFKLPVTVYTGFREPLQFGKDHFEKEYVDEDELLAEVIKIAPEYDKSYSEIQQDSKNKSIAYLGFKTTTVIHKGTLKLTSRSKMILAGASYDLSELMSNDICDIELKEISEHFAKETPAVSSIAVVQKDDIIVPILNMEALPSKGITFPIRVFMFARGKFEVTQDEYREFLVSLGNEIDTNEAIEFNRTIFEDLIVSRYPDFSDNHLDIQYNKAANIVVPVMKLKKVNLGKGEKLYPTDATISLIWTQYKLESKLFNGKEVVSEKEILEYLSTLHCEYQPNTTTLIYDEKLRLIKPMYKGSSKGANIETISNFNELEKRCNIDEYGYQLFESLYVDKQVSRLFRVESTPVSLTIAPITHKEGGRFEFRLPKVPLLYYEVMNSFFDKVSMVYDTEVMLRLFYKKDTQNYHLELPVQAVTASTIDAEFDPVLQANSAYIHIADFHSHNKYPASFSERDDMNEKSNLVYGVFGPYNTDEDTKFCLRASTGGYYKNIKKEELFAKQTGVSRHDIEILSCRLLSYAAKKLVFR